jgi:hypothetical protein
VDQLEQTPSGEGTKITRLVFMHEIQRVRYLIQSYFRARLLKIEKYVLNILGDEQLKKRLSPRELQYANVRPLPCRHRGVLTCVRHICLVSGSFQPLCAFPVAISCAYQRTSDVRVCLLLFKGTIVFSIICVYQTQYLHMSRFQYCWPWRWRRAQYSALSALGVPDPCIVISCAEFWLVTRCTIMQDEVQQMFHS